MIGVIWDFVKALVKTLFGMGGGSKDPSSTQLSQSNAVAMTELHTQEVSNEIHHEADVARANSDAHQLSGSPEHENGPAGVVNTDPVAPVNTSNDAHFRD